MKVLFKRVYISIVQRPLKSIILLSTVFLLSIFLVGSFIIKTSTTNLENTMKNRMGAEIGLISAIEEPNETFPQSKQEQQNQILEIERISQYANSLDSVSKTDYTVWADNDAFIYSVYTGDKDEPNTVDDAFAMKGVSSTSSFDLIQKNIQLKDGRWFNEDDINNGENYAVVYEGDLYTSQNNEKIKLGDTIQVQMDIYAYDDKFDSYYIDTVTQDLIVIGFFTKGNTIHEQWCADIYSNMCKNRNIYTTSKWMLSFTKDAQQKIDTSNIDYNMSTFPNMGVSNTRFNVDSTDNLETSSSDIEKFFKNENIQNKYKLYTSNDYYNKIASNMVIMKNLGSSILYGSILCVVIILSFILLFFIQERQKEIGIYLSLGISLKNIILQLILESMIISAIAVTLSIYPGKVIADKTSSNMIQTQQALDEKDTILHTDINLEAVLASYTIVLNTSLIIQVYIISLSATLIATIVPGIFVRKVDPKRILMNSI